jgi:type II secretory pathway component PulK
MITRRSSRRGVALLAALWLIVAIAAVALQFSLAARERRVLGLAAADRGRDIALATGALSSMQARMEYDLRNGPTGEAANSAISGADPWFGADSVYSGTTYVDSFPVDVLARDLGTMININVAQENDLRLLFGYVLGSANIADKLAQAIMDWRDVDENPRPNGAEAQQYLDDGRLVLPANGPFREVDDLVHLYGMTDDVLALLRPYITTHGETQARINLNAAPEPVLRALPGMSDAILAQILSLRSMGRRITSVSQVLGGVVGPTTGGRGSQNPRDQQVRRLQDQLSTRTIVNTTDVELTFFVRDTARTQPFRFIAVLTRNGTRSGVSWQLW